MKGSIRKVAIFLNKPMSEENVEKLYNHLQIPNFSKNVNVFCVEGEVKGWTNNTSEGFVRQGNSHPTFSQL